MLENKNIHWVPLNRFTLKQDPPLHKDHTLHFSHPKLVRRQTIGRLIKLCDAKPYISTSLLHSRPI